MKTIGLVWPTVAHIYPVPVRGLVADTPATVNLDSRHERPRSSIFLCPDTAADLRYARSVPRRNRSSLPSVSTLPAELPLVTGDGKSCCV